VPIREDQWFPLAVAVICAFLRHLRTPVVDVGLPFLASVRRDLCRSVLICG
jgi:hypothetical protein